MSFLPFALEKPLKPVEKSNKIRTDNKESPK